MEKIKREVFETWMKKCNWFKINDVGTPDGQQRHYLTPAGEVVIAQYNLQGELAQIVTLMPAPPQATPMRSFRIDPRGGGQFPGS